MCPMLLLPSERFLFIGDSITDCGRGGISPSWDRPPDLGDGYVSLVHAALLAVYPDYRIRILNQGVSGNTVRDLEARWHSDVLRLRPTWLSIQVGINDVWRHFQPAHEADMRVSIDDFSRSLHHIIQQVRSNLSGLILMSPYYLEANRHEPMRALMDQFGDVVRQAAAHHNGVFVDLQGAFDAVLPSLGPEELAPDRVHVNQAGHMIIARTLLDALGFDWMRPRSSAPRAG